MTPLRYRRALVASLYVAAAVSLLLWQPARALAAPSAGGGAGTGGAGWGGLFSRVPANDGVVFTRQIRVTEPDTTVRGRVYWWGSGVGNTRTPVVRFDSVQQGASAQGTSCGTGTPTWQTYGTFGPGTYALTVSVSGAPSLGELNIDYLDVELTAAADSTTTTAAPTTTTIPPTTTTTVAGGTDCGLQSATAEPCHPGWVDDPPLVILCFLLMFCAGTVSGRALWGGP